MAFYLLYNFATRLGFTTVIVTYLTLAAWHALATPVPALDPSLRLIAVLLGLGAVVLSYRTLTVALPDCQLMALAASAFMAVLPGHVATVSQSPGLALAELLGASLVFGAVRAVTRVTERGASLTAARFPLIAAAVGAVGLSAVGMMLRWVEPAAAGALPPVLDGSAILKTAETVTGVTGFFATFWLPEAWAALPAMGWLTGLFALGTVAAAGGAGMYWREMAHNQAGLTVPETAAFRVFYGVAGLGLLAGVAELLFSPLPRGTVTYPALASLALIGIVGFEMWFPALLRPLVVFAVLVFLLMVNIVGLLAIG